MCRLFGLLGTPPAPADRWLVTSDRSLLAQAHTSEEHAQADGWGIAWRRTGDAVRIERGVGGAYAPGERERFVAAARSASDARGSLVIGHLRHASNPLNLPRSRLIGVENSQPFTLGPLLFAHNGMIPLPRETRPRLAEHEQHLQGVNDSEVVFLLLAHHLAAGAAPPEAFGRTVADLVEVWEASGRPTPQPYTGLNVLLSRDPDELWAFCHWRGEHGPSFFDATRPYYQMAFRADAQHALVASEPFDGLADWRPIPQGTFVRARLSHGLLAVEGGAIPLPAAPSVR